MKTEHTCGDSGWEDDCPGCQADAVAIRKLQEIQRKPPPNFKPDVQTIMSEVCFAYMQGRKDAGGAEKWSNTRLDLGPEMFDEFERSLIVMERFVDREPDILPRHLMFRASRVYRNDKARPYSIKIGELKLDPGTSKQTGDGGDSGW